MGQKVTFDATTKIIQVDIAPVDGVVNLDVKIDLYSDGKEDWRALSSLFKYRFPIRSTGGDPLPGSKDLGATFFLDSGWKIRPYEGSHTFRVNGNLFSEDGTSPFTNTTGTFNVFLEQSVSSLVDSTVAQLKEIEYASFGGGVSIDVTSEHSGTDRTADGVIIGTPPAPVNNIDDAHAIANDRGFLTFYIIGDLHLTSAVPALDGHTFVGSGRSRTAITIDALASVTDCTYFEADVVGTLDGDSKIDDCKLSDLNYIQGEVLQCILSPGTITLGGSGTAHFLSCYSGQPGSGTPTLDLNGSGMALAVRDYNGGLKLTNKSGTEAVSVDLNSGQVILDSTITNGELVFRGKGKLTDADTGENIPSGDYNGATIVNELTDELIRDIHKAHFNKRVWDKAGNTLTLYEADGTTVFAVFDTNSDLSEITPQ